MADYQTILFFLVLLAAVFLWQTIEVLQEHERAAEFNLGRYRGLHGPGLVLKLTRKTGTWTRIRVGDRGELVTPDLARFQNVDVPIEIQGSAVAGTLIRIVGFKGSGPEARVLVSPDATQARVVRCEKCGHEMQVG